MDQYTQFNQNNDTENNQNNNQSQNNYNQNSYDNGSYSYNGNYNQSQQFTSELKNHQYDGLISIITGILSLFFFHIIGIVLSIIAVIFGISARKIPAQKTYGTVGLICGIISLVKISLFGLISIGLLFPLFSGITENLFYGL